MDIETLKKEIQGQVRSSMLLSTAFIGIHNHLFDILHSHSRMAAELLAKTSNSDLAYLKRWLDAAYSFGLIDEENENFFLTETGLLFTANHESSMMGAAIQAVLGAHMADRISALMKSGERPGESILLERPSIAQNFGVMLEKGFSPLFNQIILPGLAFFKTVNENRGSILDLGCGNGWYLRNIAKVYPDIKGTGVDGFSENINEAKRLSEKEGLHKRLDFSEGDLFRYQPKHQMDVIAMNRALHHVWHRKEEVFLRIADLLKPGGRAVIWEPRWPDSMKELKDPSKSGMAFQNLSEHAQGNYFLTPAKIEKEFQNVHLTAQTLLFVNGNEAVTIGTKS